MVQRSKSKELKPTERARAHDMSIAGMSYAAIASEFGVTPSAIARVIARANEHLSTTANQRQEAPRAKQPNDKIKNSRNKHAKATSNAVSH